MKIIFASDVHGNADALGKVVRCCVEQSANRLVLTGDITGFFGSNLNKVLEPVKGITSAVVGNCDYEHAFVSLGIPYDTDYGVIRADGFNIFYSHGHRICETNPPPVIKTADALVCGHTHIPVIRKSGVFLFANPGSCAKPRGGFEPTYMIYDSGLFKILDFKGNILFSQNAVSG